MRAGGWCLCTVFCAALAGESRGDEEVSALQVDLVRPVTVEWETHDFGPISRALVRATVRVDNQTPMPVYSLRSRVRLSGSAQSYAAASTTRVHAVVPPLQPGQHRDLTLDFLLDANPASLGDDPESTPTSAEVRIVQAVLSQDSERRFTAPHTGEEPTGVTAVLAEPVPLATQVVAALSGGNRSRIAGLSEHATGTISVRFDNQGNRALRGAVVRPAMGGVPVRVAFSPPLAPGAARVLDVSISLARALPDQVSSGVGWNELALEVSYLDLEDDPAPVLVGAPAALRRQPTPHSRPIVWLDSDQPVIELGEFAEANGAYTRVRTEDGVVGWLPEAALTVGTSSKMAAGRHRARRTEQGLYVPLCSPALASSIRWHITADDYIELIHERERYRFRLRDNVYEHYSEGAFVTSNPMDPPAYGSASCPWVHQAFFADVLGIQAEPPAR